MMKKFSLVLLLFLCLSLLALSGCGGEPQQVPEDQIEADIAMSELFRGYDESDKVSADWAATHHYSEESHIDMVDVTATLSAKYGTMSYTKTLVYQYDRSGDIWSLIDSSDWSDPTLSLKYDRFLGKHASCGNLHTVHPDNVGSFDIKSVENGIITIDYDIKQHCGYFYLDSRECHLTGTARGRLEEDGTTMTAVFNIEEFPDGYKTDYDGLRVIMRLSITGITDLGASGYVYYAGE